MTDRDEEAPEAGESPAPEDPRPVEDHQFSAGQGFEDPYEGFDLDPPELDVDLSQVDPVDSRVVTDLLDEHNLPKDQVDADDLIDVGLNYVGINRFEQATDAFERAAQFADEAATEQEALVNKGVAHAEAEEYDAAVDAYRAALHVDEEGEFAAQAHTNLAYALWERGETESAFEHAERAVTIDQRLPQAWYNLGFIENERGLYEDAAEVLDNAIRLGHRTASVYQEKARALEGLGRETAAEEARERAEQIREERERELVE